MTDFTNLARALLPATVAAGAVIMGYFRNGVAVETKAGGSPVTAADRDAEIIIIEALAKAAPGVRVIAEESSEGKTIAATGAEFFLVDPLDGTKEFTSGRPEFTVNIALVRNGLPCFGIIYAPAMSQLYITLASDNAVRATLSPDTAPNDVSLDDLVLQRIRVRDVVDGEALTVSASRSHGSDGLEKWMSRIAVKDRVNVGSSLKFCQVATGESDVYPRFGPTMEWDTAAGHAILLAAGGIVTDVHGAPLRYGKHAAGYLNPHFIAAAAPLARFYAAA
ncbi:MAG: 3'(2'),5'-bisphosphate nucleotidase CysQ [Hyphomicrobiaceae bacterium]